MTFQISSKLNNKLFDFYYKISSHKFVKQQMDDISNDLNEETLENIVGDIEDDWLTFVQITLFKTYSFKDDEIRNEYIKQGKEWIEKMLVDTDFNDCEDINLKQNVQCPGTRYVDSMRACIQLNGELYAKEEYYIMNNKSAKKNCCYLMFVLRLFGLWCLFDTIAYFKTKSNHKSFVFVKELKLEEKDKKGKDIVTAGK